MSQALDFIKNTNLKNLVQHDPKDQESWPEEWKRVYYKLYPRMKQIALPAPSSDIKMSLTESILARKSGRTYNNMKIPLSILSDILYYSCGITSRDTQNENHSKRAYPSGGARYPLEVYLSCGNVENAEKGLYHYNVLDHTLELLIKDEKIMDRVAGYTTFKKNISKASVIIMITAIFDRTLCKYKDRGMRFILLEAGHLCQNLSLLTASYHLVSCAYGGYSDDKINELLDIRLEEESCIYIFAFG
jgi:SagB-type dehydrogenase family enzyme